MMINDQSENANRIFHMQRGIIIFNTLTQNISSSSIAMVFMGDAPHYAHKGFGKEVGADIFNPNILQHRAKNSAISRVISGLTVRDYDVVISEGTLALLPSIASKLSTDTTLIYLCADHRLYDIWNTNVATSTLSKTWKKVICRFGKPFIKRLLSQSVDGVLSVSKMLERLIFKILGRSTPVSVTPPYISPSNYRMLDNVHGDLGQKSVLMVGSGKYKGIDTLIKSWSLVLRKHPEASLTIIGDNDVEVSNENIHIPGYVDSLKPYYEKTSLYIHPAKVDAFPVSVLEAMRAGVPPIVTETTGVKSEVLPVDESLVREPTADDIADGIMYYFSLNEHTKYSYSKQLHNSSINYSRRKCKKTFKTKLYNMLDEIDDL